MENRIFILRAKLRRVDCFSMTEKSPDISKNFAIAFLGHSRPRGQIGKQWVFQGASAENRNVPNSGVDNVMIRRYVIPHNPKTPAQTRQRNLFSRQAAEWVALTQAKKDAWNRRAKRMHRWSGYALFMSGRKTNP